MRATDVGRRGQGLQVRPPDGERGAFRSQLPLGTEQNLTWEALRFPSSTEFQDSPDDPGECGIKKIQM